VASGEIVYAYPTAQVRDAVAKALQRASTDDELIRRAAFALAQVCFQELRDRFGAVAGRRVVVLAGPGNNGADAVVAGKHLRDRGAVVTNVATAGKLNAVAERHLAGDLIDATTVPGAAAASTRLQGAELVVDGIVGDAMVGALSDGIADLVDAISANAAVVAVDLPSGVAPDTGETPGAHVSADVTVSFEGLKPCLFLPPGDLAAGRVVPVNPGAGDFLPSESKIRRLTPSGVAALWPVPTAQTHKFTRGMVGVVAGTDSFPGAAVLTCLGAYATGTGIVRYTGPREVGDLILRQVPEAERRSDPITADDERLLRANAWVLGPGVAHDPQQDANVLAAMATGLPYVADAGALDACVTNRAGGDRPTGADHVLVTPHAGEAARLLTLLGRETTASQIDAQPLHHAQTLAELADVTVLLKGATTLVVSPEGTVYSQADATPWLATGGAGDVLAGIAGALLASGLDALTAGALAAYVHGRGATLAAAHGPIKASDVARYVPAAVREALDLCVEGQVRKRADRSVARVRARAAVRGRGR
jgi:hydroxyethylthiazole kinase-like uncharacterized protein yjeF